MIRQTIFAIIPTGLLSSGPARARVYVLLAAASILLLAVACDSEATVAPDPTATVSAPPATAAPAATTAPASTPTQRPSTEQPAEGHQPTPPPAATTAPQATGSQPTEKAPAQAPTEGLDLSVILATTVLEVGEQRVAFLLATPTGLVKGDTSVSVTPVYLADDTEGSSVETRFHQWPYGVRGAFAAEVDFDRPGPWRLDITAEGADGGTGTVDIEVTEDSSVPFIGSVGPLSENKTLGSVGAIELITTDYTPDLSLYEITIREAVESPLPAVVVFASPAFCTTATCGPQVDAVSELRESYDGQAHFIHVEIYDNPDEIQGDLDRARIAPTVDEWGLTSIPHWFNESWTFVLDSEGRVQDRFEGFATVVELEESLQSALN